MDCHDCPQFQLIRHDVARGQLCLGLFSVRRSLFFFPKVKTPSSPNVLALLLLSSCCSVMMFAVLLLFCVFFHKLRLRLSHCDKSVRSVRLTETRRTRRKRQKDNTLRKNPSPGEKKGTKVRRTLTLKIVILLSTREQLAKSKLSFKKKTTNRIGDRVLFSGEYVCIVMYGHGLQQSIRQPGLVANPACGQLNREMFFSLSPLAPEYLASRDKFDRSVPPQPAYSPHPSRIWCLPAGSSPFSRFPRL